MIKNIIWWKKKIWDSTFSAFNKGHKYKFKKKNIWNLKMLSNFEKAGFHGKKWKDCLKDAILSKKKKEAIITTVFLQFFAILTPKTWFVLIIIKHGTFKRLMSRTFFVYFLFIILMLNFSFTYDEKIAFPKHFLGGETFFLQLIWIFKLLFSRIPFILR